MKKNNSDILELKDEIHSYESHLKLKERILLNNQQLRKKYKALHSKTE